MTLEITRPVPAPAFTARIERWPTEIPLRVLVMLASLGIWALLALSIIGAIYAAMIVVFLFFSHVAFITYVRGSAVRLGPEQFPELWTRVVTLSKQAGLQQTPEAYVMEAGGSLNAFATKLFGGRMIVLFSDLLDACGDDHAARDMVIGHEIGHLKLGHLDWAWLTAPGRLMPFLGSAYSRACEFSCDRWGAALCGDRAGATRGLAILAAGGKLGKQVNLSAYVAQRENLDTGWMTIGCWISSYPPLSARVEAIEPALGKRIAHSTRGPLRAAFILSALLFAPALIGIAFASVWAAMIQAQIAQAAASDSDSDYDYSDADALPAMSQEESTAKAWSDLATIAEVIREHHQATGEMVLDSDQLDAVWSTYQPTDAPPSDPFDGLAYGFQPSDDDVAIYSSGPDTEPETEDDIVVNAGL